MKDQYIGDINDFAKYQVLRVCAAYFHRLVVAWMLTEADGRGDGRNIGYLRDSSRGAADPDLFKILARLVENGERTVAAVEESLALPDCIFHAEPLPADVDLRAAYFAALARLGDPNSLVFLDPDNGFEVPSAPKGTPTSKRYVYWDELVLLRDTGSSVLVYQHFPRVQRDDFVRRICRQLGAELGPEYRAFAAYSSLVGFFFGVRKDRAQGLANAVARRCAIEPMLTFAA